jgi:hypothetical protein
MTLAIGESAVEIARRLWIEMVVVGGYARPAVDIVAIFGGYAVLNCLRQSAEQAA